MPRTLTDNRLRSRPSDMNDEKLGKSTDEIGELHPDATADRVRER